MLIGLCGAAGAGKNAVAEILRDRRGFTGLSFAGPIYRAVAAVTGLSVEQLADRTQKERPIEGLGKSPRELLQTLGTEWGRDMVRSDIWIVIAMRQAEAIRRLGGKVAVSDVRFQNEAEAIRAAGGVVWQVARPVAVLAGAAVEHASEAGLPAELVDTVIDNSGSLDDLVETVEDAFSRLSAGTMAVAS